MRSNLRSGREVEDGERSTERQNGRVPRVGTCYRILEPAQVDESAIPPGMCLKGAGVRSPDPPDERGEAEDGSSSTPIPTILPGRAEPQVLPPVVQRIAVNVVDDRFSIGGQAKNLPLHVEELLPVWCNRDAPGSPKIGCGTHSEPTIRRKPFEIFAVHQGQTVTSQYDSGAHRL